MFADLGGPSWEEELASEEEELSINPSYSLVCGSPSAGRPLHTTHFIERKDLSEKRIVVRKRHTRTRLKKTAGETVQVV